MLASPRAIARSAELYLNRISTGSGNVVTSLPLGSRIVMSTIEPLGLNWAGPPGTLALGWDSTWTVTAPPASDSDLGENDRPRLPARIVPPVSGASLAETVSGMPSPRSKGVSEPKGRTMGLGSAAFGLVMSSSEGAAARATADRTGIRGAPKRKPEKSPDQVVVTSAATPHSVAAMPPVTAIFRLGSVRSAGLTPGGGTDSHGQRRCASVKQ